jgi:hypothetical protein
VRGSIRAHVAAQPIRWSRAAPLAYFAVDRSLSRRPDSGGRGPGSPVQPARVAECDRQLLSSRTTSCSRT